MSGECVCEREDLRDGSGGAVRARVTDKGLDGSSEGALQILPLYGDEVVLCERV